MSRVPYLRVVPSARHKPSVAARIAVRLSVSTTSGTHGRSREFRIADHDLAELIHAVLQIEGRK